MSTPPLPHNAPSDSIARRVEDLRESLSLPDALDAHLDEFQLRVDEATQQLVRRLTEEPQGLPPHLEPFHQRLDDVIDNALRTAKDRFRSPTLLEALPASAELGQECEPREEREKPEFIEEELRGFKYFEILRPYLKPLRECGYHANRKLYFDQYVGIEVFYFFNPTVTSMRGLTLTTHLEKVQQRVGVEHMSLGSFSESPSAFDPQLLRGILRDLASRAPQVVLDPRLQDLRQELRAVDGTLLPALPRMAWAVWLDEEHRAAKAHVEYKILEGVPYDAVITDANTSEVETLKRNLEPDCLYVIDRGYVDYAFYQAILDAGSSVVGRLHENASFEVLEERPLTEEDRKAGVVRDVKVRLGCESTRHLVQQPVRIVEIQTPENEKILLITDRFDLPAEVVAVIYRHRWHIEIFFRWFKCILKCTHLLSESRKGVALQVYAALIASLLVTLWVGDKPKKRTYEMLCHYFTGLATEEELTAYLERQKTDT